MSGNTQSISAAAADAQLTSPGQRFETEEVKIGGVPFRVWKNGPKTMRQQVEEARAFGRRRFIVYEDEAVSFEGFYRAVSALAGWFIQRGIMPGDRIALAMRNLPEWPVVLYAGVSVGAIVTPLNAWWTKEEMDRALRDCDPRVVVVDNERFHRLATYASEGRPLVVARGDTTGGLPGTERLENIIGVTKDWELNPDAALPEVEVVPDQPATMFFTSGTTGFSKGACSTHRAILHNIMAAEMSLARAGLRRGSESLTAAPLPRAHLVPVPFFHVTGCFCILSPNLSAGGKLVLMRKWDTLVALRLIEKESVTVVSGVPTIAKSLVEHPRRKDFDLSSLRTITYGGAPAPRELAADLKLAFPQVQAGFAFGMTEASGLITQHVGDDYINRPCSCGLPLPVMELEIRSASGTEVDSGVIGELWVRGFPVITGYWNSNTGHIQSFRDGWMATGDLGYRDEDGFLFIVDRLKEMVIRGGENIYCAEIESALHEYPAVAEAAVVGVPHPTLGEEPAAVVTLRRGFQIDDGELKAFLRQRLAAFKIPPRIVVSKRPLPRNANGKVVKKRVRALLLDFDHS